ncbi:MAG: hypothetical protein KZQ74_05760 [gamma proteobacterium symbiont of Bathyaustriella thionipta]|nr:hypothetical protein [gamma proteobacterium symbiont of Bathyaustriella thionipta]MCU7949573.1 hypothetical protein [gamma proteobacterium symbiont of Bathyaustriella thionipta]MCU7956165.1 hypothetical protein [gamma proteobacterium symbiont of Bathyaustriella thionipta]MCU7966691.1 hypothetical protein [gamma proteobacterium symbiont of Bathyaustriella thionipta]
MTTNKIPLMPMTHWDRPHKSPPLVEQSMVPQMAQPFLPSPTPTNMTVQADWLK